MCILLDKSIKAITKQKATNYILESIISPFRYCQLWYHSNSLSNVWMNPSLSYLWTQSIITNTIRVLQPLKWYKFTRASWKNNYEFQNIYRYGWMIVDCETVFRFFEMGGPRTENEHGWSTNCKLHYRHLIFQHNMAVITSID